MLLITKRRSPNPSLKLRASLKLDFSNSLLGNQYQSVLWGCHQGSQVAQRKVGFCPKSWSSGLTKRSWRALEAKADYFIPGDCAAAALLDSWLLLHSPGTKSLPGLVKLANVMNSNSVLFAQGLEKISCFHVHKQNLAQHTRELRGL